LDLIIRNARLGGGPNSAPVDIGIDDGRIAAIAPRLAADGPRFDAQGRLACPGLIETHIHLDKSRIIDSTWRRLRVNGRTSAGQRPSSTAFAQALLVSTSALSSS
jgi:cytosine/adenosine deaminase-related metal-dependent hydrolase